MAEWHTPLPKFGAGRGLRVHVAINELCLLCLLASWTLWAAYPGSEHIYVFDYPLVAHVIAARHVAYCGGGVVALSVIAWARHWYWLRVVSLLCQVFIWASLAALIFTQPEPRPIGWATYTFVAAIATACLVRLGQVRGAGTW